jgi:hypothetical protein
MRYPFGGLVRTGRTRVIREMLDASAGPLRESFAESRRRVGVAYECVWIIATPFGDVVVGIFESDDPHALSYLQYSDDQFDVWFVKQVEDSMVPTDTGEPLHWFEWTDENRLG